MSEERSAGQLLVAIFLILCGLCLVLVGGGCSLLWIAAMFGVGDNGIAGNYELGIPLLLVSLAALGAGGVVLWAGGKVALGKM
jgi:hypothetical protein